MPARNVRSTIGKDVLLAVHGTGAGSLRDEGEGRWWQLDSKFSEKLGGLAGDRIVIFPAAFHWSGRNSEKDRRAAGIALYDDWLSTFELLHQPYHLIGHSHGGSVIWAALCEAERRGAKLEHLKSWTTVGTPFLHYRRKSRIFIHFAASLALTILTVRQVIRPERWVPVGREGSPYALLLGLANSALGSNLLLTSILGFFSLVALAGSREHRLEEKASGKAFDRYRNRWLGLRSRHDEAISMLRGTLLAGGPIVFRFRLVLLPLIIRPLARLLRTKSAGSRRAGEAPRPGRARERKRPIIYSATNVRRREGNLLMLIPAALALFPAAATIVVIALNLFGNPEGVRTLDPLVLSISAVLAAIFTIMGVVCIYIGFFPYFYRRKILRTVDPSEMRSWIKATGRISLAGALSKQVSPSFFFAPVRESVGVLYNAIIADSIDRFTWSILRRRAQGNDLAGRDLSAVLDSPHPGWACRALPDEIDKALDRVAGRQTLRTVRRLRIEVGAGLTSEPSLELLRRQFQGSFTAKEFIHCGYFDSDDLALHLGRALLEKSLTPSGPTSLAPIRHVPTAVPIRARMLKMSRLIYEFGVDFITIWLAATILGSFLMPLILVYIPLHRIFPQLNKG